MALLEIRKFPDPVLRVVAARVTKFDADFRKLCEDMAETMYAEPGVGLAAPQVGASQRFFVGDGIIFGFAEGTTLVFANPEILSSEGEQEGDEGCLSFPGIYEKVNRPFKCRVRAQDIDGHTFELDCEGLACRAIFHEIDHLEGRLMIDYLSPLKRQLVRKEAKKGFPNAPSAQERRSRARDDEHAEL
jgi:peptide deformylase